MAQPGKSFDELQAGLGAALAANRPGATVPHAVVAMASHSVNESMLSHYGDRVFALEHRFLASGLMTHRLPYASWLYLSSVRPTDPVVDYLRRLGPDQIGFAARTRLVELDDTRPLSMARKLLDQPQLLESLRLELARRVAVIEPWNVTDVEVAVAEALQLPVNGADPKLRHLGHKSAGRRLFRQAGAPVPAGLEGIRTPDDLTAAVEVIRSLRPGTTGVVVKHDDSGAGDGNVVLPLRDATGRPVSREELRASVLGLPDWYLTDLQQGGVVEELLGGREFTSPSCQIDLLPDGSVTVLATHEQVLGGENGQVFQGCRFPADSAYAADHGGWRVFVLEVNLRKGGTSHPYSTLRNLVPGRYEPHWGSWLTNADHTPRAYACTDNFVDPAFVGLDPAAVIRAVQQAGVEFDHRTQTGVVLHMLAGLGIDGRFGYTCIGRTPVHTAELEDVTRAAVHDLAATGDAQGPPEVLRPGAVPPLSPAGEHE
jgi:hypothetical protein